MIGMVLITVLMCVNFSSCNDDEDENTLKSKIIGEWGAYQKRSGNYGELWKDCDIISKITFYSDGHYIFESVDPETGKPTGSHHNEPYEFNESETEMYDGSDWHKIIISTEELDQRPFEFGLMIFSNDFKRMKLWGWKFKKM